MNKKMSALRMQESKEKRVCKRGTEIQMLAMWEAI